MTDADHPYVNLSDGGHFENLGLYEMVRRRCRFIVVCDAGCDPSCAFEDLGNAIRKIRIDLGIPIDFDGPASQVFPKRARTRRRRRRPLLRRSGRSATTDVDGPGAKPGTLIYIKPAICAPEPYDVYNYAKSSAEFPHESDGGPVVQRVAVRELPGARQVGAADHGGARATAPPTWRRSRNGSRPTSRGPKRRPRSLSRWG